VLSLLVAAVCSGCASRGLYDWGSYEKALYDYHSHPDRIEDYVAALEEIVNRRKSGERVPPGLHAEYGYALFISGEAKLARTYFLREKQAWPESSTLMDIMLSSARARPQEHSEPAGTDEAAPGYPSADPGATVTGK